MNFFDRWSHFFFCGIILVFHDGLRSFVLSSQGFFCLQNVTSFLRFHEPFLALISHMALLISATVVRLCVRATLRCSRLISLCFSRSFSLLLASHSLRISWEQCCT